MSRFLRAALVLLVLCLPCARVLAAPMQQAFLVQNSGWMEPFYTDTNSQFKPLVAAVVRTVARPEDPVFISAFNQATPDNPSPVLLAQGQGPGQPDQALARLGLATKNKRGALADTDFQEAVAETIKGPFKTQPGIIWIFTNNKNSPNNDAQTALRNRDFYRLLHLEPSITRTLAFPLRMPLKGKVYSTSGMMVYALAYGDSASAHLAWLLSSGAIGKVFTNPPARLKPIDQESVRLIPKSVVNSSNVSVSLAKDGRTMIVDVKASDVLPQIEVKAAFQNLFYPYVISDAKASAAIKGAWGSAPVTIKPDQVQQVQPGEEREVTASLPLPLGQVPSAWSPAALSAMGKQVVIPAVLEIALTEQRLLLSDAFQNSLKELFPGDPLAEVFLPPESVKSSSASLPLVIRIQYPLLPVVMVMLLGLLLLAAAIGLVVLAGRTARYDVLVDGQKRAVAVKAFGTQQVRAADGSVVGTVKRGLGKPRVTQVAEGHTLVVKQ